MAMGYVKPKFFTAREVEKMLADLLARVEHQSPEVMWAQDVLRQLAATAEQCNAALDRRDADLRVMSLRAEVTRAKSALRVAEEALARMKNDNDA